MRKGVEENATRDCEAKQVENDKLKTKLKKEEKDHEKSKIQYSKDLNILRETLSEVTKSNVELKLKLTSETALVAALTEELNGDDNSLEEAVEEGEASEEAVGTDQNVMNRNKEIPAHKCLACDKIFKASVDLERHLADKHPPQFDESEYHMCKKVLTTRKQVVEHMCLEGQIVLQKCPKCEKEYVSSAALEKHVKSVHAKNIIPVCTKCGEAGKTREYINKHMKLCGNNADVQIVKEKSRVMCNHWRRGNCTMGSECNFSHVGYQASSSSKDKVTNTARIPCRNGHSCSFLARGRCRFQHHMGGKHQGDQQETRRPSSQGRQQSERARCRFGARCDRVINCPYIHSLEDFPMLPKPQGQKRQNHQFRQ